MIAVPFYYGKQNSAYKFEQRFFPFCFLQFIHEKNVDAEREPGRY